MQRRIIIALLIIALVGYGILPQSVKTTVSGVLWQIFGPITGSFGRATDRTIGFFGVFGQIRTLSKDNERLRRENLELRAELGRLGEVKEENETLRAELNFANEHRDQDLLPAQVQAAGPTSILLSLQIDKGGADGVKIGNAVISSGYLVGRINKVSSHTAEVYLVSNSNALVPAITSKSRATGIVRGGLQGLIMEDIPLDAKLENGEMVVTTTVGGEYPEGVAIGAIGEVRSKKSEIFQRAVVISPIQLRHLKMVFVVKS